LLKPSFREFQARSGERDFDWRTPLNNRDALDFGTRGRLAIGVVPPDPGARERIRIEAWRRHAGALTLSTDYLEVAEVSDSVVPTITSREFVSVVAVAFRSALPAPDRLAARYPGAAHIADRPRQAIRALQRVIAERPCDAVGHRLLGVAHLHAGELPLAARHLGTAFDLLSCQIAAPSPARTALRARLQLAALDCSSRLSCQRWEFESLRPRSCSKASNPDAAHQ
jgi:hypothetical protein